MANKHIRKLIKYSDWMMVYPFMLYAFYIFFPENVFIWLSFCHNFFDNLPPVFPFLSRAKELVELNGLAIPYIFYIHSFWVLLLWAIIQGYPLVDSGDWPPLGRTNSHLFTDIVEIAVWVLLSGLVVFAFVSGVFLNFLFDYPESSVKGLPLQHFAQLKPIMFVFFGCMILKEFPTQMLFHLDKEHFLSFTARKKIRQLFS